MLTMFKNKRDNSMWSAIESHKNKSKENVLALFLTLSVSKNVDISRDKEFSKYKRVAKVKQKLY